MQRGYAMNEWTILKDKIFDSRVRDGDSLKLIAQVPDAANRRLFLQAREMRAILKRTALLLKHQYPSQEQMNLMGLSAQAPLRRTEKEYQSNLLQLLSDIHSTLASL
jgi:hypothetical protein